MNYPYRIFDGYQMTHTDHPSTEHPIMRSTGLSDSQGAAIYECDILTRGSLKGVVEHDGHLFYLRTGTQVKRLEDGAAFTVVGNAFENPNLA